MTAIKKKKKESGSRKFGRMILDKIVANEISADAAGTIQKFASNDTLCNRYTHPHVGTVKGDTAILELYLKTALH